MATKTISITEDAYEILKSMKKGSESFSDVIKRINSKNSLLSYVGILEDKDAAELEKTINASRNRSKKRTVCK